MIVDTLRADALSCYGNPLRTSPHLDRLAERSARFAECFAQAPNTATSHATLFTGLHPWTHRVANLTSFEQGTPGLPDAFETLAERFSRAGYRTAAFTDGGPLGRTWNLCQGFEVLEARYEGVRAKVDAVLAFLDARDLAHDARPLFLFVHTYEVHVPYVPAEEWIERFDPDYEGPLVDALAAIRAERAAGRERQPDAKLLLRERARFTPRDWEHLRALYHAEVAYTDQELARLFERLGDETILAVTSDHGEEFLEHGEVGHVQLHRETLHVPLLLSLPGAFGAGVVVSEPVGLVDLHATLLEAAGLPTGGGDSRSLLPLLRGERDPARALFAETTEHLYSDRPTPWRRSVRFGGQAFFSTRTAPDDPQSARISLFDLARDPTESNDLLAGPQPSSRVAAQAAHAQALLESHLATASKLRDAVAAGRELDGLAAADAELARELEALGYLDAEPERRDRDE